MKLLSHLNDTSPWKESPSLLAGKCWIFPSNSDLTSQVSSLSQILDPFLKQWTAHGSQVEAEAALLYGHFLMVVEGVQGEASSGCSQDALRAVLTRCETAFSTPLLSGGRFFYEDPSGHIAVTSRQGFVAAIQAGMVGPETLVFDTLVQKVSDLRRGSFVLPAKASWHQKWLGTAKTVT